MLSVNYILNKNNKINNKINEDNLIGGYSDVSDMELPETDSEKYSLPDSEGSNELIKPDNKYNNIDFIEEHYKRKYYKYLSKIKKIKQNNKN